MIIENNLNVKNVPISRINVGECFIYNNHLYIKVECIKSDFPNIVVDLETNHLNTIGNKVLVMPINAKVVIG